MTHVTTFSVIMAEFSESLPTIKLLSVFIWFYIYITFSFVYF